MSTATGQQMFEINFEASPRGKPPKRFLKQAKSNPLTHEILQQKQKAAEERRKAFIQARLDRIHEKDEEIQQLIADIDKILKKQTKIAKQN